MREKIVFQICSMSGRDQEDVGNGEGRENNEQAQMRTPTVPDKVRGNGFRSSGAKAVIAVWKRRHGDVFDYEWCASVGSLPSTSGMPARCQEQR
jgi:hypothetical protein